MYFCFCFFVIEGTSTMAEINKTRRILILNQPQGKFRFRYASEMTGTHGCLMAESKDRHKKEFIRVQVCNVAI